MYSHEYTQLLENIDRIRSLINRTMVTQMAKSPSLPALSPPVPSLPVP